MIQRSVCLCDQWVNIGAKECRIVDAGGGGVLETTPRLHLETQYAFKKWHDFILGATVHVRSLKLVNVYRFVMESISWRQCIDSSLSQNKRASAFC